MKMIATPDALRRWIAENVDAVVSADENARWFISYQRALDVAQMAPSAIATLLLDGLPATTDVEINEWLDNWLIEHYEGRIDELGIPGARTFATNYLIEKLENFFKRELMQ